MAPLFDNTKLLNEEDIFETTIHMKMHCLHTSKFVEIPRFLTIGNECIKVVNKNSQSTSMYTCSDIFSPEYLASILNSYLGLILLLGNSNIIRKKQIVQINESELIKVPIYNASPEFQKGLGDLQMLIQNLYEIKDNSIYHQMMKDYFENVRDGMVLELYFSEIFKIRDISIWESWNETLNKESLKVNIKNAIAIYECIKDISSLVRRSLKHLQVLRNSPNFKF